MVVHDVGDGLRVGGGAGPAAPDCVVHLGQFVGDAVGDVGAGGGAGVGAEDDALGEGDGHADGGRGLEMVVEGRGTWGSTLRFLGWRGEERLVKRFEGMRGREC